MHGKGSSIGQAFGRRTRRVLLLAILALLVSAAALLLWRGSAVNRELAAWQHRLVAEVVNGTWDAISLRLQALQRAVALLAEDEAALIQALAADPDDEGLRERLHGRIARVLPEAFAFTITSADGDPLLADFDGLVGEVCEGEIRRFVREPGQPELVVHPNPVEYHFDVMHPVALNGGGGGVFFVSFGAEVLARVLAEHPLPGYDLFLENREDPGLIEVGVDGARDALQREIRLSPGEQGRIAYRLALDKTRWDVVAVPQGPAPDAWGSQLSRYTLWALGILGTVGIAALLVIRRFYRAAESAALELDRERSHWRAILDTVAEAIVTIDERGAIQSFNPAAERIFGYAAAEAIGQNVRMLIPEPYASEHDGYLARYLETGDAQVIGHRRELMGQRKDLTSVQLELAVSEIRGSERRYFTGAMHDITERKQAERAKREFVSIVSHELRTPLTSIRGSLGLVAGGAVGAIPDKVKHMINIALNNSDRLVGLVNDILDMEKIDSGKMQLEIRPQRLVPVVEGAIESSHGFAIHYGVDIELAPPAAATDVSVAMDADRITQVLANLLSNAVKFSPRGDRVRVTVERSERGVRVAVADSGTGIPATFRDRIFERFAQADASDQRQTCGSGLGLSICKAIIGEHGGEIGFDSEPGRGSTFYIELPAIEAPTEAMEPAPAQGPHAGALRLLVCEHDHDIATLIRLILEQGGYRADIAHDVARARSMIAKTRYDAVTMDLSLPGEDGLSFIRELRAHESTRELPIVVLSARAELGRQELEGAVVGVVDWLGKPIDQGRLLSAVRRASGKSAPKVLHVEDDHDLAQVVAGIIGTAADVRQADSLRTAKECLHRERFDLVILDLGLPDGPGISLLPIINRAEPPPPVLIFSASELPPDLAPEVSVVLIKSRTDNFKLVETVNALLRPAARDHRKAAGPA